MKPCKVKAYRKRYGFTQLSLSKALGCSKRTVEGWENGAIKNFSEMGDKLWSVLLIDCPEGE